MLAWSGGKDSAWALERLRAEAEVVGLFTTVNRETGKVAVHDVPVELLRRQAAAVGLPVRELAIPASCPNDVYERVLRNFVQEIRPDGITHLAFGDLFLEDIRAYRERIFAASGVGLLFPLWGSDTAALARQMTSAGLRAWITSVDTQAAPADWAGRVYDARFVEEVRPPVDPCGENGEFHTFVFEGPMLRAPVRARVGNVRIAGRWANADLVPEESR